MAPDQDETATKRIPLTPTAWDEFRAFCRGMDVTYSEAVLYLLHGAMKTGEDAMSAGRRIAQDKTSTKNEPTTIKVGDTPQALKDHFGGFGTD